MNAVIQVTLADCRERLRRFSIVAVGALAAFLGYQVIAGALMIRLGPYRGVLNAPWIGILMATAASFFLSLAGFYLVRGNIGRDRDSGVGQILSASPLRASSYVIGKLLSNAVVLSVVVAVLMVASMVMLMIHAEGTRFDPVELLLPFFVFAVPVALTVAATAVLFECMPILRLPVGSVVFFFLWLAVIPAFGGVLLGFDEIERSMGQAILAQGGDYRGGVAFGTALAVEVRTFVWTGFDWGRVASQRALLLASILAVIVPVAVVLHGRDRFDSTRSRESTLRRRGVGAADGPMDRSSSVPRIPPQSSPRIEASAVRARNGVRGFLVIVTGEFRLFAKGRRPAWYLVAGGLIVASIAAPLEATRRVILPLAWLWPVLIWSEMGVRESRHRVDAILAACPSPVLRQTAATWTAAVLLAVFLGAGALVRFITVPAYLPGFFAGAVFIPSLALFLGAVGRTDRFFHVTMMALWYIGPVNGVAALDYTGATEEAIASGMPRVYAVLAAMLISATLAVRARRATARGA